VQETARRARWWRAGWRVIGGAAMSSLVACQSLGESRVSTPELIFLAPDVDAREAEELLERLRERHGVVLGSGSCADALRRVYAESSAKGAEGMRSSPWRLAELEALERAMIRYAPWLDHLGGLRAVTGAPQLVVGKVHRSVRRFVGESLVPADGGRMLVIFHQGLETTQPDFPAVEDWLEAIWIHELGHAFVQRFVLDEWIDCLDYWDGVERRSRILGTEAPVTIYGATSADEDLCEALMFYMLSPRELEEGRGGAVGVPGNPCPTRYELLRRLLGPWLPPGSVD